MEKTERSYEDSPAPPPLPGPLTTISSRKGSLVNRSPVGYRCVSTATQGLWDQLFDEAYRADVAISTDSGAIIYGHSSLLVSSFAPHFVNTIVLS